jgi:hypothetical protein
LNPIFSFPVLSREPYRKRIINQDTVAEETQRQKERKEKGTVALQEGNGAYKSSWGDAPFIDFPFFSLSTLMAFLGVLARSLLSSR